MRACKFYEAGVKMGCCDKKAHGLFLLMLLEAWKCGTVGTFEGEGSLFAGFAKALCRNAVSPSVGSSSLRA